MARKDKDCKGIRCAPLDNGQGNFCRRWTGHTLGRVSLRQCLIGNWSTRAMGWFDRATARSDVFTKREVDDVVLKSVVNVLGDVLGVKVNGMALDGALTVSWEAPDKQHNEVVINMEA